MVEGSELSVLTFNIWGLGLNGWDDVVNSLRKRFQGCGLAADLGVRVRALADYLASSSYDIVLLQEVWMGQDYATIREATKESYPFAHFFDQGIVGSGTCILSKHTIQSSAFHEFSLNGYPHAISHGDWFAGKGLGFCRILYKEMLLNVFVSHLHAEYCRSKDVYLAHRIMQSLEAAQWISLSAGSAHLTLYAGDMNTEPSDVPYNILRSVGCLSDSWLVANRGEEKDGGTCATPYNTYTMDWEKVDFPAGKRIDYIMYSSSGGGPPTCSGLSTRSGGIKAEAVHASLPLKNFVPASFSGPKRMSYSDHEALAVRFKLSETVGDERASEPLALRLSEATSIIEDALKATVFDAFFYLALAVLSFTLFSFSFKENFLTDSLVIDLVIFIVRLMLTGCGVYSLLMGSLFHLKEKNSLRSAKASLQLLALNSKKKEV